MKNGDFKSSTFIAKELLKYFYVIDIFVAYVTLATERWRMITNRQYIKT